MQINQDDWNSNSTLQSLLYVDNDNIFDGRLHAFKENTEALVVASKKTVIDVSADKI